MEWLDEHGTRGVGALQLQVTELVKDVTRVEAGQEEHTRAHAAETKDRQAQARSTTRWGVGIVTGILLSGLTNFITVLVAHSH